MHPRTKFIVLSGYEEFEYVKIGITLGIQNYILKPINIEELEATIKHIRGDWEREELKRFRSEEDWKVLRSNILQRWVNGEIKSSELKQEPSFSAFRCIIRHTRLTCCGSYPTSARYPSSSA